MRLCFWSSWQEQELIENVIFQKEKWMDALDCIVYRSINKSTGLETAVSIVSSTVRKKSKIQIKILMASKHVHIVRIYGIYESKETLQIVWDIPRGGNLCERLWRCSIGNEMETSRAFRETLSALLHLHDKKIVHGCIRPQNIVYSSQGRDSKMVLVQFGKAKTFKKSMQFYERLREKKECTWTSLTDLRFLPPVVVVNPSSWSSLDIEQIDIWAWGVILYMSLFASFPFDGTSASEIESAIIEQEITFPPDLTPYVSRAAKDLLHRIFTRDAAQALRRAVDIAQHPWIQGNAATSTPYSHQQKLDTFADYYDTLEDPPPFSIVPVPPSTVFLDDTSPITTLDDSLSRPLQENYYALSSPGGYMQHLDAELAAHSQSHETVTALSPPGGSWNIVTFFGAKTFRRSSSDAS